MNTLPFFILLSPNGEILSDDKAHAILSSALKKDIAVLGLRREIAMFAPDDASALAHIALQSPIDAMQTWCKRFLSIVHPHLGSGCLYVVFSFTETSSRIIIVSHSTKATGTMSNLQQISLLAKASVATTVASLCKAQNTTPKEFQRFLLWQAAKRKSAPPATGKPAAPTTPVGSGMDI